MMNQSSPNTLNRKKIYEDSLSALRKKDPKLNNLRANVKISFFESFKYAPLLLQNINFSYLSVNSKKQLDGSEKITIWGKQLEGFCMQLKTSCEKILQIITKCNDQDSFLYVQNFVSSSDSYNQNQKLDTVLREYDTEICFADKMKFNTQANIMRYNIRKKDTDKFAIESQKTTVVRKIIYKDFLKPLLDMYKQAYKYQIQGDIILFDFISGNYMPSITNIREYIPSNDMYENLYYICNKMYNLFCRGNEINSYDFYDAMNSLYQKFLNNANHIKIQTMAQNALANIDINNIENELIKFQNDIMSDHIQQNKFIDSYRIIALAFINIAINGYGTNTFENVNILGINFGPNILSKSKDQMIFHFKSFKENFLNRISAMIKMNSLKMRGPNLSNLNFESRFQDVIKACHQFSVDKRIEYNKIKKEYNDKRKELENLLLKNDILSLRMDVNQSEVESLKNQINNKPFNFSISDGMVIIQLGSFSVKVNFGVIIHFGQKFGDLKLILENVEQLESLIQKLDIQDKILSLYNDSIIIKNDSQNIAVEIQVSKNNEIPDITVLPIMIPKHS